MDYLGELKVVPKLPEQIKRLKELAYNFYFSWHPEVRDLFIEIDKEVWKFVNHNPVKFLHEVQQKRLEEKAQDRVFLEKYKQALTDFDKYMRDEKTWFSSNFPEYRGRHIAYFTAEFGFHESLPIYAGGLGVLAGDHIKSASDLGIPLTGVSLFYQQTYFTQEIDAHGNQIPHYLPLNPEELPLRRVSDSKKKPLILKVPVANRMVFFQLWKARVGRISVYLLDTNVPQNTMADRQITARLYGGDQEMRISQEIVLGMGGALALQALGIEPAAWHMNEGHSVFLALQRIKDLVRNEGLKFEEALEATAANTIFTTHTPVPAGNDAFPLHIKDKYFQHYWESVGIHRHRFMELGSQIQPQGYEIFNLTILSLNLSRYRNAVSRLHGYVSKDLWKTVWPDFQPHETPISSITNGVHAATWISRKIRAILQSQLSNNWEEKQDDNNFWNKVDNIPDQVLWNAKLEMKQKLLNHIRERLQKQYRRNKTGSLHMLRISKVLKAEVLTIGFARRFATYKRATLVFRDLERLKRLVNNPEKPVQIIFAGKAHPKDSGGQDLIRQIYDISLTPDFRGKIIFVENYDMGLARDLISGVDVWMNNPRRTQEASGTSGQKGGMNSTINFSVLDGWWDEGFNGKNGWAFGENEDFDSLDELDSWDSDELYDILENEIIPLYYNKNESGLPVRWIRIMKESMKTITPVFNTHRMVKEYWNKLYIPAINSGEEYRKDNFSAVRSLAAWKDRIERHWSGVAISPAESGEEHNGSLILKFGDTWNFTARVKLGKLTPQDVKVQLYLTLEDGLHNHSEQLAEIHEMSNVSQESDGVYLFSAQVNPKNSGNYQYTLRVIPYHPNLINQAELGLACWYAKGN